MSLVKHPEDARLQGYRWAKEAASNKTGGKLRLKTYKTAKRNPAYLTSLHRHLSWIRALPSQAQLKSRTNAKGQLLQDSHDTFFSQHNLSMRSFIISLSKNVLINYISSPEVNFLRSIVARFNPRVTKLVFRFIGQDDVEPSTNQTYGSLLKNLTFIKTFASGILVPKSYIWPVDNSLYLQPYTSLVLDAHKEGLQIFASEFANDVPFSYNYSYDPAAVKCICPFLVDNGEYLCGWIKNHQNAVCKYLIVPLDTLKIGLEATSGILVVLKMTFSFYRDTHHYSYNLCNIADCFTHLDKNDKLQAKLLIITSEGASGDYPGCTNLAYTKAASDGADVLDCPVQMAKDGIPFCLGSINLIDKTSVSQSPFSNIASTVPELNITNGIVTFNLTWDEIKSLKPSISNPWSEFRLYRNPKARNDGKFVSLVDFLTYAENATTVSGVMISIENAAYLANQGFGVTAAVREALRNAGYNNQTAKKVMIQSKDSSVLKEFKKSRYELVYRVADDIRDIESSTISEIKNFASSVILTKKSVFPSERKFVSGQTDVVQKLQSSNLPAYVQGFNNEFVSQAWDFFSDSSVEINNYIAGAGIDGVITDFPGTAARYRRNRCLGYKDPPMYLSPVEPGGLLQIMARQLLPPAEAPNPILSESDVVEPPLPPVAKITPTAGNESTADAAPTSPISQSTVVAGVLTCCLAILLDIVIF
ncbi:glycerophosphodiester phosphodiesterase GDPDL4-like [Lycium ferocissimum]|uniref:glycerophosphodiester phosphodiesterase GDPDL4-like n=1 Tax=Lycium ferocissimum TaxID=112874 RepID=UPI002814E4AD|nr:glycerophosphodiester phosphodiesterase GDPDL4-like [Lycium ferocissimum]